MNIYVPFLLILLVLSCSLKTHDDESAKESSDMENTRLVWSDEFDSDEIDLSRWEIITGDGCPELCGFGNNELQYYSDREQNLRVEKGRLLIQAVKDSLGSKAYTSGKLVSRQKGDWKYGRIEVKAKVPTGKGTWAAIWMMPTLERETEWPLDGEIDIMEHVGYNPGTIYGASHTGKYNHIRGTQRVDSIFLKEIGQDFHIYALEWDEESMTWFVDDQEFQMIEKNGDDYEGWPFDQTYHMILNLAVGGNWGGKYGVDDKIWPQTLEVDWVRVYQ